MEQPLMMFFGTGKRFCLSVRGKDRAVFLHRLLTQDIKGTPVGQARPAFLLDRQGKILIAGLAHVRPDEILLELGAETMEPAGALLEKYHVSEAVEITPVPCPGAQDTPEPERIAAGIPAIGKEITPDVIPNELGPIWLEQFVSFTKGCYIGQEIVARIKYRAHPPRLLTGFLLNRLMPEESALYQAEEAVGTLTSVCESPALGKPIGLGFLKYGTPPGPLHVGAPASSATATPTPLPIV